MSPIYKNLNPEQLKAVETLEGPLLILAGAGSGKTRVLTHRIANIISQGLAQPENILAVTFTNKAAKEMRERAHNLLHQLDLRVFTQPLIATFHSFCVQVLRSYIHILDYSPSFTIYDRADQISLVKKIFKELNFDTKVYSHQAFLSTINSAKVYGITPDELLKEAVHTLDKKMAEVYKTYEERMKDANALDFDDLLLKTILIFEKNHEVLDFYQSELKYIMVDEYQDTSTTQYKLIHLLAKKHRNLCAVGDEDQSIYSWRGANIDNILSFEKDYPETHVIKLEENYRSTKTIVTAASHVIRNNALRKDKTLFTNNADGDKILAKEVQSEYEEGKFVAQNIQSLMRGDGSLSYDDFAIFYRANSQSRAIEEELKSYRIPYQMIGGVKFYDRMEVKDLICYLRLLLNPQDDISFLRVLNTPTRGIGDVTVQKLIDFARSQRMSLLKACQEAMDSAAFHSLFNRGIAKKLEGFVNLYMNMKSQMEFQKPSDFLKVLIEHLQYSEYLKFTKPDDYSDRLDNINELVNVLVKFEKERGQEATLSQFLEEVSLVSDIDDMDENQASVKMMTLHVSKGLEYPCVFIVGFEEGLFPSAQSLDSHDSSVMEEERRLCYVGMTRAKEKLFLSFSRKRMIWGQEQANPPSRFLKEIPAEFIDIQSQVRRPQNFQTQDFNFKMTKLDDPFPDYETHMPSSAEGEFHKGSRVRHPAFGVGTITVVEGNGEDQKVTILFTGQKLKKFILKYARLEKV